ncbi:alpha/beta hydrolase [Sedimenticola hydrogenitrophicus]|uniref:alpha/beta hydrolase n=1 Tax=Sedimenticola hydrogenitrophicus TaxID=2967975 RepID=UPI0021A60B43|nr:alpha/beta hydrolase [Sedimenticola hydrogenitrophicus]
MSNTPMATSIESSSCAAVPRELEHTPMAGVITRHELGCIPRLGYYLYVPASCGEGAPLMVAVHGISCNAKSQVRQFVVLAERYGVILAAPRFTAAQFPAYQRLGVRRGAVCSRPDQALHALVEEVGMLTGARTDRLFLFGHSGGGQFVHRYAMAYPQKVQAVTMGAPGWYTFPDDRRRFPRGVATANAPQVGELCPEQFLQVPMAVFVGARDIYRDEASTPPGVSTPNRAGTVWNAAIGGFGPCAPPRAAGAMAPALSSNNWRGVAIRFMSACCMDRWGSAYLNFSLASSRATTPVCHSGRQRTPPLPS